MRKLAYDETVTTSYGLWHCPSCDNKFYGGGSARHKGCTERGYDNCIFLFGPKQVKEVKKKAEHSGEDAEWYGISLKMLREQFPQLV